MSAAEQQEILALVKPTLGAILLGLVFSSTFFGVTLLQTYQYYDRYWSDTLWLKLFVALIFVLDVVQIITVIHSNWWYLIQNYAMPQSLSMVPWSLGLEVGITTSIGLLVQGFFAMRVYILSRGNHIVTGSILTLTLAQFILGVYYAGRGQQTKLVATIAQITWASTASLACSIAGDAIITGAMCYYLHLSRSGIRRTDKLIDIMIVYCVNTGLLTTICAVCTIILSEVVSNTYWDTMFYFLISKCYVNSTLATLNAREKLRGTTQYAISDRTVPLNVVGRSSGTSSGDPKAVYLTTGTDMSFAANPAALKTDMSEVTTGSVEV
ncbi:uncharacterized protein C8Q71DRAFT_54549 [Rhodofomes roseus]|uniref:DUF6534 domain-containing protein n=1 Tax=Rhodofomes roseus TaxID=34475 RepID=A0ABQ8KGJ9_9APHY|nr:uncharacterized protein C8Q71DRAFT_54549 [Rhodofomes roseus]KAH9836695.1 hypothetical protein C8Q71DRAFT_54549 [Rhodofomes roseus]